MVEDLLKVSGSFRGIFSRLIPEEAQAKVSNDIYAEYQKAISSGSSTYPFIADRLEEGFRFQYFKSRRSFSHLVSDRYRRTCAPRLTTNGSTFHGMNKILVEGISISLTETFPVQFIELDMGAAHARVAAFLQGKSSPLHESLNDLNFWDQQTELLIKRVVLEAPRMNAKYLRKMLKVSVYTSLNGGNPASDERLCDNFELNAKTIFSAVGEDKAQLMLTPEFKSMKQVLSEFKLGKALKDLNKTCVVPVNSGFAISKQNPGMVFTVDKSEPYLVTSAHMGISRVLQGFELIMLSNMVQQCVRLGGLPVSLDHDGIYVCLPQNRDPMAFIDQMDRFCEDWGKYLLEMKVPITGKRVIVKGKIVKLS